jgi:gamma-glutamylcyclotransferase
MSTIHYFAYGSNMLAARLRARQVRLLDQPRPAVAQGYRLVFNKESVDGSSKANLMAEGGAKTWGVLFSVDPASLTILDEAEGAPDHYRREYGFKVLADNTAIDAMTYIAQPGKTTLAPGTSYDWYLALILAGAKACADMPSDWINQLRRDVPTKSDTKTPARKTFAEAVAQLNSSGYANWRDLLNPELHPSPSVPSVVKSVPIL